MTRIGKIASTLLAILAVSQAGTIAAQASEPDGAVQNSQALPAKRYPIAFRTGYDSIDRETIISDAIGYELIAPLPSELKAASVKGLFWFHPENSVYIEKPPHIAGIVPAKFFSHKTFENGVWKDSSHFKYFIIVFESDDGYDYSVVYDTTPDQYFREGLPGLLIFDEIFLQTTPSNYSGDTMAYTLRSERGESARWRVAQTTAVQVRGARTSRGASSGYSELDLDRVCSAGDPCENVFFVPQPSLAEALTERQRYLDQVLAKRRAQTEREKAERQAERNIVVTRVRAMFGSQQLGKPEDCGRFMRDLVLLRNSSLAKTWWEARQISEWAACDNVPLSLQRQAKEARTAFEMRTLTAPRERDYWKEIQDAIGDAPTVLKCTKNQERKTETCRWVKPG